MPKRRGVFIFVILFAVLGAAVLIAAVVLRGPSAPAIADTVLIFNVPENLEEAGLPSGTSPFNAVLRDRLTLWRLVDGIRRAAEDDHITGLVLHVDAIHWGWAKVSEVRDALADFRRAGKPVYASLSGGGEREYLLASVAGTLSAPPLAVIQLDGLTGSAIFLRGTLDKVGVTPNFAHVGRYKSGVETWTKTGMSPESREALGALVNNQYRVLVDSLASARGLRPNAVERLLDEGPYGAGAALAHGLLDTLLYRQELDSLATGTDGERRPTLALSKYLERLQHPSAGPRIALVMAAGTIADGKSRESPGEGEILGAETLIKALRDARTRSSVKAIVLRIDSPGGSAQASDEIWNEVRRCRERKPVIVSMSDLAASGGYYIAVAADSIVAHPGTITGSIGVYGGKLNILGLYRKLGLNVETISRGRHAEMLSPFRDFTADEAGRFQAQMDEVYRLFLSRVTEGRGLESAAVDSVGRGRVWSGVDALRHGLVDELGGLPRALELARARAGISPDHELIVEVFPRVQRTLLQRLMAELISDEDEGALAAFELPSVVRAWLTAAQFPAGVALALLPFSVEIR